MFAESTPIWFDAFADLNGRTIHVVPPRHVQHVPIPNYRDGGKSVNQCTSHTVVSNKQMKTDGKKVSQITIGVHIVAVCRY